MEPALSFEHAALKIKWADVLLHQLNRQIALWVDSKPYEAGLENNTKRGGNHIVIGAKPVPFTIACLAGDISHNLRNALDYAWMGLVRASNPGQREKKTFPFADNRKGLKKTIAQSPIKTALGDAERLLLDGIKPHRDFNGGGNRNLCALNELSNWQKHNMLALVATVTSIFDVAIDTTRVKNVRINRLTVEGGVARPIFIAGDIIDFSHNGEPTLDIFIEADGLSDKQSLVPTLVNFRQASFEALKAVADTFPTPTAVDVDRIVNSRS